MKHLQVVLVGLVIMAAPQVRADDPSSTTLRFIRATFEQTQQELLAGLHDTRPEILSTVAVTVGELKKLYPERSYSPFVIPLMRIVKNENGDAAARVNAAIALHELRSSMGDFAISRTAKFTDNGRVRHICAWLTQSRLLEKHGDWVPSIGGLNVESPIAPLSEKME